MLAARLDLGRLQIGVVMLEALAPTEGIDRESDDAIAGKIRTPASLKTK